MPPIRYRTTVIDNGLRVLTVERASSPLASSLLLYAAGSLHEPPGKTGVAHLTEHMMFRGSRAYPAGVIDSVTANLGGTNNAVTTADYTAYYFVLPVEHWRVPLAIEADRMTAGSMTEEAFALEKRVALEERSMLDDDPEAVLDEAADMLAFERHPYRYPVVGLRDDIERLTHHDVREFYDRLYAPDNAVLAVAGGVRHDDVVSAAEEYFGEIRGSSDAAEPVPDEPAPTRPRSEVLRLPVATPSTVMAFRVPGALHDDSAALEVLAALLSSGRSSRLYRRLVRTEALATEVGAYRLLHRHPSLFYVSTSLHPGVSPERLELSVLDAISELAGGLDNGELDKAKSLALVDHAHARETCLGLAGAVGLWEVLGDVSGANTFDERMRAVTDDDLVRVAEEYLRPETRSSAWLIDSRD